MFVFSAVVAAYLWNVARSENCRVDIRLAADLPVSFHAANFLDILPVGVPVDLMNVVS